MVNCIAHQLLEQIVFTIVKTMLRLVIEENY